MIKEKSTGKGYKFFLVKAWFDKGFSWLNYLKYLVALIGLDRVLNNDLRMMIYIIVGYAVVCFIIGFVLYHWRFVEVEQEVANRYNLFVQEMRKDLKKRKT